MNCEREWIYIMDLYNGGHRDRSWCLTWRAKRGGVSGVGPRKTLFVDDRPQTVNRAFPKTLSGCSFLGTRFGQR